MLSGTKRTLLQFEGEDAEEVVTPEVSRYRGLTTPPASPEKKRPRPLGAANPNLFNIQEGVEETKPQKLSFGRLSVLSRAKSLLQKTSTFDLDEPWLPTRKDSYQQILQFLQGSVGELDCSENSLYITGPPGTGKTAQVELIIREKFQEIVLGGLAVPKHERNVSNVSYFEVAPGVFKSVSVLQINCVAVARAEAIMGKIMRGFSADKSSESGETLEQFFRSKQRTNFVLILDEMDKLIKSSSWTLESTKIMVELFLLSKSHRINFTLIGIANSLDMNDRLLNLLNLQEHLLPKVLNFQPYNSDQMVEIINKRLSKFQDCSQLFQPIAIRFAANKCSGATGDLRKLFDLLRSSVEVMELEGMKAKTSDIEKKKVNIAHVAKAITKYMNSSSSKTRINKLNIQQKIILCSLVHKEKFDIEQSICSIDNAYDYYVKLLNKTGVINPLTRNEFLESCNALQMFGVANIENSKTKRIYPAMFKTIKSSIVEAELQEEISKIDLLRRLL